MEWKNYESNLILEKKKVSKSTGDITMRLNEAEFESIVDSLERLQKENPALLFSNLKHWKNKSNKITIPIIKMVGPLLKKVETGLDVQFMMRFPDLIMVEEEEE